MTATAIDFYAVTDAYIDCALWATSIGEDFAAQWAEETGEDAPAPDVSLESFGFTITDLDSTVRATINETVRSFLATAPRDALRFWAEHHGDDAIGHDLFLTSAGHGAGFWDRWSDNPGARYGRLLTDHAKPYGELSLYVGDNGRIYG